MAKKLADTVAGQVVSGPVEEYCTKPYFDDDGVQVASGIGIDGKEYPDPVPLAAPIDYSAPPDLMQMIRQMVHSEAAKHILQDAGIETIDEADDFDIEDDPLDPLTEYERVFFPPPPAPAAAPPTVQTPPSPVQAPSHASAVGEGGVSSPPPVAPAPSPPKHSPT